MQLARNQHKPALARVKFDPRSHVPNWVTWPYYEGVTKGDGKGWKTFPSPPAAERVFRFLSLEYAWIPHEVHVLCLKLSIWSLLSGFSSFFRCNCGGIEVTFVRSGGNPLARWRTAWSKARYCLIDFCINYVMFTVFKYKRSHSFLTHYLRLLCWSDNKCLVNKLQVRTNIDLQYCYTVKHKYFA